MEQNSQYQHIAGLIKFYNESSQTKYEEEKSKNLNKSMGFLAIMMVIITVLLIFTGIFLNNKTIACIAVVVSLLTTYYWVYSHKGVCRKITEAFSEYFLPVKCAEVDELYNSCDLLNQMSKEENGPWWIWADRAFRILKYHRKI